LLVSILESDYSVSEIRQIEHLQNTGDSAIEDGGWPGSDLVHLPVKRDSPSRQINVVDRGNRAAPLSD
jgi:hypothetical protein